ncbi:MAG: YHS domain-containing protein [Fimbriimonas sp.]
MNKIALVSILSVAVVGIGVAQTKKPAKPQTMITCAVMPKDPVTIADATKNKMYSDYKGRRYYFCCAGCPEAFKKNPAKYAKNASLPVPKPAPKKK